MKYQGFEVWIKKKFLCFMLQTTHLFLGKELYNKSQNLFGLKNKALVYFSSNKLLAKEVQKNIYGHFHRHVCTSLVDIQFAIRSFVGFCDWYMSSMFSCFRGKPGFGFLYCKNPPLSFVWIWMGLDWFRWSLIGLGQSAHPMHPPHLSPHRQTRRRTAQKFS